MIGIQVESKLLWYDPNDTEVYSIEDYSSFKKELILDRFEVHSVDELAVGSYVEDDYRRVSIVEIDV